MTAMHLLAGNVLSSECISEIYLSDIQSFPFPRDRFLQIRVPYSESRGAKTTKKGNPASIRIPLVY